MSPHLEHTAPEQQLQQSLDQLTQIRAATAPILTNIAAGLAALAEQLQRHAPPPISEAPDIMPSGNQAAPSIVMTLRSKLETAQQRQQQPALRLLVLGDVKRGKSTIINALLGATVLPSAPNPCTAVISVLRYGPVAQATLQFSDHRPQQQLSLEDFQHRYTLSTEKSDTEFDNIAYAVIEYPSPLLQSAVEIIDSPGLNDTVALNQRSLQYLSHCHAVLFVMRAVQPCTLTEQRYIQTHLTNKGMTPFFLLNGWDEIQASLLDPADPQALAAAEARLKQVFTASLQDYIASEPGFNIAERVFPLSALRSLRHTLNRTPPDPGFSKFVTALTQLVADQRTEAQTRPLLALSKTIQTETTLLIDQYLRHFDQTLSENKKVILMAAAPFETLAEQRDTFAAQLKQQSKPMAVKLADNIRGHFSQAEQTFQQDFSRYQPPLQLTDQLTPMTWQAYHSQLEAAFLRYLNDRLERWRALNLAPMQKALGQLAKPATGHGQGYRTLAHQILNGIQLPQRPATRALDWGDWINDLFVAPEKLTDAAHQHFEQQLKPLALELWTATYKVVQEHLNAYGNSLLNSLDETLLQQQQDLTQRLSQHQVDQHQYMCAMKQLKNLKTQL
ncbi:MAG: dynamin family protein, partial [Cyanobacteria bacterium J06632_22]